MTKAEFLERLAHDPIVIEPIAKSSCYRIALHGDFDPTSGVVMGLGPGGGTWLADDYEHAYARVGGRTMRLTYRGRADRSAAAPYFFGRPRSPRKLIDYSGRP
jgi:hypothetical protein